MADNIFTRMRNMQQSPKVPASRDGATACVVKNTEEEKTDKKETPKTVEKKKGAADHQLEKMMGKLGGQARTSRTIAKTSSTSRTGGSKKTASTPQGELSQFLNTPKKSSKKPTGKP